MCLGVIEFVCCVRVSRGCVCVVQGTIIIPLGDLSLLGYGSRKVLLCVRLVKFDKKQIIFKALWAPLMVCVIYVLLGCFSEMNQHLLNNYISNVC